MSVEERWGEVCIGVKCEANVERAGSPRTSFSAGLRRHIKTVEHGSDAGL